MAISDLSAFLPISGMDVLLLIFALASSLLVIVVCGKKKKKEEDRIEMNPGERPLGHRVQVSVFSIELQSTYAYY